MGTYFELLDKEIDLSFDLSLLDCILLNEDSNLDSVEATISYLIDEIQNQKSEHTKASKRESKQKSKRFAAPLSTKQIEYLSMIHQACAPKKHQILPNGQLAFCQIGAMRSMGVVLLYWIAQHIYLNMSKLPMAIRDTTMAIPCQHLTLANSICH